MREETKTLSIVCATVGIVFAVVASHGCEPAYGQAVKPNVDPKADALLHKMSSTLGNTPTMKFDADHVLEVVTVEGEKLQFLASSKVGVQRPNKFRTDRTGAVADLTVRYDGNTLSIFGKKTNMYAQTDAPESVDETLDMARDKLGIEAPGADLIYKGAYEGLMEDVISGRYIGLEPVGDKMCHHLAYRGNETDWQIWIADGDQAVPCRYVVTSKLLPGSPEYSVRMSNWNLDAKFDPEFFAFTPPKDAVKIQFLQLAQQTEQAKQKTKQGRQP